VGKEPDQKKEKKEKKKRVRNQRVQPLNIHMTKETLKMTREWDGNLRLEIRFDFFLFLFLLWSQRNTSYVKHISSQII
jgi:hypothetical protein